jgi:hypothetical protein
VVEFDHLKERLVDALGAVEDGHDGGFADQVGQRDDVAAGAAVEVVGEGEEAAGLVCVQAQCPLESLDEQGPFLALRDGAVVAGGGLQARRNVSDR